MEFFCLFVSFLNGCGDGVLPAYVLYVLNEVVGLMTMDEVMGRFLLKCWDSEEVKKKKACKNNVFFVRILHCERRCAVCVKTIEDIITNSQMTGPDNPTCDNKQSTTSFHHLQRPFPCSRASPCRLCRHELGRRSVCMAPAVRS